jgi:hypothetical protein
MPRWSPVYVPEIETGRHIKNNACTREIKIKWMMRKHMTYENTYHDDTDGYIFSAHCKHVPDFLKFVFILQDIGPAPRNFLLDPLNFCQTYIFYVKLF